MEEYTSKKKQLYLVSFFLILLAFIIGWTFSKNSHTTKITNPEEIEQYVGDIYKNMNSDLYASIDDKKFVQFATTTIEKKCPFYKPDGITYRACLSDWEQELEGKNLVEQNDEIHAYCSTFTQKYTDETSLAGQELFLKCAIYKSQ